jgi:hypothetical protein
VRDEVHGAVNVHGAKYVVWKLVSAEGFGGLPGWCRGLLTVELLNGALDELAELAAGR